MTSAMASGAAFQQAPLLGLLWDQGGLTKEGASRFARLTDGVIVSGGPRREALGQAAGELFRGHLDPPNAQNPGVETVTRWMTEPQGSVLPAFLGVGTPFDAAQWVRDLLQRLRSNNVRGVVIVIPGSTGAVPSIVALTKEAKTYVPQLQNGITAGLGHKSPGVAIAGCGEEVAVSALNNQTGDVVLVYAIEPYDSANTSPSKAALSAADVVHVIMKDTGLEVTNRTEMPVEMRIHLGAPGSEVMETLQVHLDPRKSRFFTPEEMGSVGLLEPPVAELRQWSHEAEVVYEGGHRRIHLVEIHYLQSSETGQQGALVGEERVIGVDQFGSPDALVSAAVSTQIAQAIGKHAHSVGSRMAGLASRKHWREVLRRMIEKA